MTVIDNAVVGHPVSQRKGKAVTAVTARQPRVSGQKTGWRSMVVTDDRVVLGHESVGADRDGALVEDGARLLDDIGRLLEQTTALFGAEGGTVIVSRPPGGWSASPLVADSRRDLESMVSDAAAAGWTCGGGRAYETGWFTFRRDGAPPVHLGVRGMLERSRTPLWDTSDSDVTPERIAHQLARWHAYTGAPFRQTPGVTGCGMIRDYFDSRGTNGFVRAQPLWLLPELPDTVSTAAGELRWRRALTDAERQQPLVVSIDMRAARLNAMGMTDSLAFGRLRHVGHAYTWNRALGGFWQVAAGELAAAAGLTVWWGPRSLPPVNTACADANGMLWLTTPMMRWLEDHQVRPLIHDAYVADKSGQWLRRYRDQVRGALQKAGDDLVMTRAIKQLYVQTAGMMAAPGGSIYRRDWNNAVIDHERARVLDGAEKIWTVSGWWPVRCNVDELFYAVESDRDWKAMINLLGDGPQLGKWKIKERMPMAEYVSRYER